MNPTAANAQAEHGQVIEATAAAIEQARPQAVVAISDDGAHRDLEGSITMILRFASAVAGPILIGRDRHFGGGLFAGRPFQRH